MMPPKVETAGIETVAPDSSPLDMTELLRIPGALLLLAKPGIVLAELLAGLAGALLASPSTGADKLCPALFCLAMAAGGAAMANGLLGAEQDRKMPRLARRSLALDIAGKELVLITAAILNLCAVAVAATCFNPLTLLLLATATLGYIFVYSGWLKRRTPWSVLAGGIPGALPPLIGAAATANALPAPALLLAAMIYLWQLPHFWFLALHCRGQYRLAGIPVLPLTHGVAVARHFTLCATLALVPATLVFCAAAAHGRGMTVLLLTLSLVFSLFSYDALHKKGYRKGFIGSLAYMAALLMAVIIGAIQCTVG